MNERELNTHARTPVELVTRDGEINKTGGQCLILPGENILFLCRERRISIASCQPICHLHGPYCGRLGAAHLPPIGPRRAQLVFSSCST